MNESFINEKHHFPDKSFVRFKKNSRSIVSMLCLLFFNLSFSVSAQTAKVSINKQNAPLSAVLDEIESQTSYLFVVNSKVDTKRSVSLNTQQKPVGDVLKQLFKGTDVAYSQEGEHIIIGAKEVAVNVAKRTLTGVVKDEAGETVINATIVIKGKTIGTVTDFDGNFSLTGNFADNDVIVVSSLGMKTQEITIGQKNNYLIVLREDTKLLNEVVVTAMGIEREAKSLTYAAQTIKSDEVTRIKEPNFINSLQGKSAGLIITPNNSGAGGGASKIVLRGQTSILGTNQPLIVIDGVPMADGMGSQSTSLLNSASRDGGDILSTINPEDIESMTVLKGPNAAALYGSSANNGVITIVTKSGKEGKASVTINSNTSIETLFMYPKTQKTFGLTPNGTLEAWGPRISEMTADDNAMYAYLTGEPRNPVKDFYNNGVTLNNGVTINGGTENARSYFSYNNTTQWGVVPENEFQRHNVMMKENFSLLNKKLDVNVSLNYIYQKTKNRPVSGRALSPIHALYRTPANVDMRYFRNNYQHPGTERDQMVSNLAVGNRHLLGEPIQTWYWYDQHLNNPYWLVNMLNDEMTKNRIMANLTAKYNLWRNIYLQTRLNLDVNLDHSINTEYATVMRESQSPGGKYWSGNGRSTNFFNDYMINTNEKITENIHLTAAAGISYSRDFNRSTSIMTAIDTTSHYPNAFDPANSAHNRPGNPNGNTTTATDSYNNTNWSTALFATASFGFWDMVYIDGSYRLEWAKSFQQFSGSRNKFISFDYYSAGANVLLDRMLKLDTELINQLKLRGSWSVVGNPIPNMLYGRQTVNYATGAISPRPPIFQDPQPETTTSYEGGVEMWMFNNSLSFDMTYYNSVLRNQYLTISTPSGESKPVNTGKIRNYGVEFSTSYRWMINNDWNWKLGFNIAYNNNKILETYKTATGAPFVYTSGSSAFQVKYLEGGAYGDLYVNSFERNPDGSIKVNNAGDYESAVPQMASGEFKTFVGNATARVNLGLNSTLNWKNLSLYFLIDGKIGGKVMSLTDPDRDYYGVSENSARDRLNGKKVVQNGKEYTLKELPDGQFVSVEKYYRTVGSNPMENYVYDATNLRMRDISLGYNLPNLLGKSRDLYMSFTVKNAFFIYKKAPIDPDISVSAANGFSGIDSYSLPTTRSYALNLKLTF